MSDEAQAAWDASPSGVAYTAWLRGKCEQEMPDELVLRRSEWQEKVKDELEVRLARNNAILMRLREAQGSPSLKDREDAIMLYLEMHGRQGELEEFRANIARYHTLNKT